MNSFLKIARAVCLASLLFCGIATSMQAQTKYPARDAMYLELGGKTLLYGVYYEHLASDDIGVTGGLSVIPRSLDFPSDENPSVSESSDSGTVIIPAFLSWYPAGVRNRIFVDAGVDLLLLLRQKQLNTGLLAALGAGYNYRPRENGYYVKVGPVLLIGFGGDRSLHLRNLLWFGIAVGKVF